MVEQRKINWNQLLEELKQLRFILYYSDSSLNSNSLQHYQENIEPISSRMGAEMRPASFRQLNSIKIRGEKMTNKRKPNTDQTDKKRF